MGWDDDLLRLELQALTEQGFDVSLTAFEDQDLARLLAQQDATEALTDEDAVPDLPAVPTSTLGDLWILGDHRVMCGDATDGGNAAKLIAGEAVDLVFSDLPYNVGYEGYTEDKLTIKGDRMTPDRFRQFLLAAFTCCRQIVKPGASMYVCHSSSWQREFQNAMEAAGFEARCQIIWAENTVRDPL